MKGEIKVAAIILAVISIAMIGCDQLSFLETKYTVEYLENGAVSGSPPVSQRYKPGADVTVANRRTLAWSGYTFSGWNTMPDGSGSSYQPGDVFTMPDRNVDLFAQWASDQADPDPVVPETVQMSYVPVPAGGIDFPTGWEDESVLHVDGPFYVSETLVTYRLWSTVYAWATSEDRGSGKYTFANPGRQGGDYQSWDLENGNNESPDTPVGNDLHPVTKAALLDALVWCNALTEWHNAHHDTNYGKAYLSGGSAVRNSAVDPAAVLNSMTIDAGAGGFRLLDTKEWELAAKWRDNGTYAVSGYENPWFTPGRSGSGANGPFEFDNPGASNEVAWWMKNEGGENSTTKQVKLLRANSLGLYDMSGNVEELCTVVPSANTVRSVFRGGYFNTDDLSLYDSGSFGVEFPNSKALSYFGFRVARSGP
jgi:uncharacterized repeat protein (TIGR02543 family)